LSCRYRWNITQLVNPGRKLQGVKLESGRVIIGENHPNNYERKGEREGFIMNSSDLVDIFKKVCQRLTTHQDRCGHLLYTQYSNNKPKIREPEVEFVLAVELSSKGYDFGLEVPTKHKYCFSGTNVRCGRTDVAVFDKDEQINIEIKEGQTSIKTLELTFQKLLHEDVSGCAIYHVLHNANRGTIPALLNKYEDAYLIAKRKFSSKTIHPKWFVLFIMVKEIKDCFHNIFPDITHIPSGALKGLPSYAKNQCSKEPLKQTVGLKNVAGWL
jgi:hypothetical protein